MAFNIDMISQYSNKPNTRRVAVMCAICEKEPTIKTNGVCEECEHSYRVGHAYKKNLKEQAENPDNIVAQIPSSTRMYASEALKREEMEEKYPTYFPHGLRFEESELGSAILNLAGMQLTERQNNAKLRMWPKNQSPGPFHDSIYVITTEAVLDRLEMTLDLARYVLQKTYQKGYRDGEDMLGKLASGKVTVSDYDAEVKKKGVK